MGKPNNQMSDCCLIINAHGSMFKYRGASAKPFLRWSVTGHKGHIDVSEEEELAGWTRGRG